MTFSVSQIEQAFSGKGFLSERVGGDVPIHKIAQVETCEPGDLVFVDRKEFLKIVSDKKPAAAIIDQSLKGEAPILEETCVLFSKNVKLAQALIKQEFGDRNFENEGWESIHESAVVHQSVEISKNSSVGPLVTIAANVKIGENCKILAGVVIESGATIGDNCTIHPKAVIGYNCRLGRNVEVGAGTVIGSEGFGFAQDEKRKSHKIPQTGNVIIEDNVAIGAGNCIDRGAYGATTIGAGTKTDNLCHIAHNVQIGQDCLLTAMLCVAGSTTIGDRVITSGQTGILDHKKVCDDVVLLHRAGVLKDIEKPGMYAALPAQPLADYMKNTVHLRNLADMSKKIKSLEKKLNELSNP